jgi:hypothetical protein
MLVRFETRVHVSNNSAAPTLREVEVSSFMEGQGNDSEFEYDDIVQNNLREQLRSHSYR